MFSLQSSPRRVFASCPHFQDAQVNGYAPEGPSVAGTSRACLRFVRVPGAFSRRVSGAAKNMSEIFQNMSDIF